jgi:hypothetical protein
VYDASIFKISSPTLVEAIGFAEVTHEKRGNQMRMK